jgi:NTE family protein
VAYRNLVFEGGGAKGVAYVGALEVLERRGHLAEVERVGGASAGAITAALLAAGHGPVGFEKVLGDLDADTVQDSSGLVVPELVRLVDRYGWYSGEALEDWLREQLPGPGGSVTFRQLDEARPEAPELWVVATNLSAGYVEVFSPEATPEAPVAEAVRASASIPLYLAAPERDEAVYVDGGVVNNYPVRLFDRRDLLSDDRPLKALEIPERYEAANVDRPPERCHCINDETLGFRVDEAEQIEVYREGAPPPEEPIDGLRDFAVRLGETILQLQDRRHLRSEDWRRTVYIDAQGVGTTDFDQVAADDTDVRQRLVEAGRKATREHLDADAGPARP